MRHRPSDASFGCAGVPLPPRVGARRLPAPPGRSLRQCWEVIAPRFVDVHSHVVPSGDDGAVSVEEGSSSAAPPPTRGRVCCSRRRTCTSRWTRFPGRRSASSANGALDRLRLDGTSAVLVEFPGWWLDVDDAVGLHLGGVRANRRGRARPGARPSGAVSRSCRRPRVRRSVRRAWVAAVPERASVLGDHGETAERIAWWLLGEGMVSLVASDAHGPGGYRCSTSPARRSPNDSAPT